jgi:hypothetical protein
MEAEPNKPSPTELAAAIGVSTPYASQLLSGVRIPPVPTAIKVFRAIGLKLGPIQGASDDEIDVLLRPPTTGPDVAMLQGRRAQSDPERAHALAALRVHMPGSPLACAAASVVPPGSLAANPFQSEPKPAPKPAARVGAAGVREGSGRFSRSRHAPARARNPAGADFGGEACGLALMPDCGPLKAPQLRFVSDPVSQLPGRRKVRGRLADPVRLHVRPAVLRTPQ